MLCLEACVAARHRVGDSTIRAFGETRWLCNVPNCFDGRGETVLRAHLAWVKYQRYQDMRDVRLNMPRCQWSSRKSEVLKQWSGWRVLPLDDVCGCMQG